MSLRTATCLFACGIISVWANESVQAPALLENIPGHRLSAIAQNRDGQIYRFLYDRRLKVLESYLIKSDGAGGYSETPQPNGPAPLQTERMMVCVIPDKNGGMHAFFYGSLPDTKILETGHMSPFHTRTDADLTKWGVPKLILPAFVGSLMPQAATQMNNGRLVLAFGDRIQGSKRGDPFGQYEIVSMYSDDQGETWSEPNRMRIEKPADYDWLVRYNGPGEPSVITLKDGRVWMVLRTPAGKFYESFSEDGAAWTKPAPSSIYSSDSPCALLRLPGGALLLLWNNSSHAAYCDLGQIVYGGRDALSAAISHDDGKTWGGFRDVYIDPYRNQTPPAEGDRGTAYPRAGVLPDGKVEIITGQHLSRARLLLDPRWLEEKQASDDFAKGLGQWQTWKAFGPSKRMWRDRKEGAALAAHPDMPDKNILHVRRPEGEGPDGAVWNFPAGREGELRLRLRLPAGSSGVEIALNDRFFDPADPKGTQSAQLMTKVAADNEEAGRISLSADQWHDVTLRWNLEKKTASVTVDDRAPIDVPLANESLHGPCYLRLRSTADSTDPAGCLVEKVSVALPAAGQNILP